MLEARDTLRYMQQRVSERSVGYVVSVSLILEGADLCRHIRLACIKYSLHLCYTSTDSLSTPQSNGEWDMHRLSMEVDLQSLFGLHVPPPPAFGLVLRRRYWSAKIDDISM